MYNWSYPREVEWVFDGVTLEGSWLSDHSGTSWLIPPLPTMTMKYSFAPSGPLFATINGTAGDDILVSGVDFTSGDTVHALAGNDTISIGVIVNNVTIFAGTGNDTINQ